MNGVLVCSGLCNKVPQTGWIKQQKCIFSQFWRLEVWGQGPGRVDIFWGLLEKDPFEAPLVGMQIDIFIIYII